MKQGTYGGFTYGSPYGFGGGLYVDSYGNLYPQAYFGSSKLGVSGGYTNDLEGLLTGLSVGGTLGPLNKVGPNIGTSGGATGFGFGTPGGGATASVLQYQGYWRIVPAAHGRIRPTISGKRNIRPTGFPRQFRKPKHNAGG
jgi:hypothetical protein